MQHLSPLDYTVIVVYFSALVALGFYLKKKASGSLEDYFIGNRSLPWWALGFSGMASFLDVTGTMIIVSFIFMLGPRGLFIEFRGGVCLILAVMLLWTGKWHRRSRCITGAEWMIFRFGEGFGGQFARIVAAIAAIVSVVGMLGYLIKGVGLFFSMFLPFSPFTCALIIIGVATLYTMISGFYGVVYTDIFQSFIIMIAVVSISYMAATRISDSAALATLAQEVTGNSDWMTSKMSWYTTMPKGYEVYRHLMIFAFLYLLRNIFFGMATGDDPKYFGARNDRECGTLTFMWTSLMTFRWPMIIGFAVLGLFTIKELFPDQTVLTQAAELIKLHIGQIDQSRWADSIAGIMNHPQNYSAELISGLQNILGQDWVTKLKLVSFEGTVNAERILPAVILFNIPRGLRGIILVALLAASMSSFDTHVNKTAGFFARDLYQRYMRPKASTRELIYTSWVFIFFLVVVGFMFAYTIKNINDIWGWISMGLGAGLLMPSFLRFYWWRFNGGGFAIGTVCGLVSAIIQRIFFSYLNEGYQFLIMGSVGLIGAIIGTYLTRPTNPKIVENFYLKTRPFGFWGHLKRTLSPEVRAAMTREHRNDILALPFTLGWQVTMFMMPMQLVIHSFKAFWVTFTIFIICLIAMYFLWYRNLPTENVEIAAAPEQTSEG